MAKTDNRITGISPTHRRGECLDQALVGLCPSLACVGLCIADGHGSWPQTWMVRREGRPLPYLAMRFPQVCIIYVKFREIWFLARCQMAKTFEDGSEAPSELHQIRSLSGCCFKPASRLGLWGAYHSLSLEGLQKHFLHTVKVKNEDFPESLPVLSLS